MNLAERVDTLIPILRARSGAVVVGSSYGGITALCAAIQVVDSGGAVAALVLCAPALARAEPPATAMRLYPPAPTVIIHGVRDEVVPIEVSRSFAADHPEVDLIEVDDEHRLAASLDVIVAATQRAIGSAGR